MKVLWVIGLLVAAFGVLINLDVMKNIVNIPVVWIEVIAVGILAIAGFPKGK